MALKLLRQGLNVLSLDVDAVLLSDIYQVTLTLTLAPTLVLALTYYPTSTR